MAQIFLGLGSNIEPTRHLRLALAELRRRFGKLRCSAVYRNAPVGFEGDDFLNMVVALRSRRAPGAILREIDEIHDLAGRTRAEATSSRELDIDLLLYDGLVSSPGDDPELPRPDVLEYDFVLRPLAELAPDFRHPLTGRRLADHWAERADSGRVLVEEPFD